MGKAHKTVGSLFKVVFGKVAKGVGDSGKGKPAVKDAEDGETTSGGDSQKIIGIMCLPTISQPLCLEVYNDGNAKVMA